MRVDPDPEKRSTTIWPGVLELDIGYAMRAIGFMVG